MKEVGSGFELMDFHRNTFGHCRSIEDGLLLLLLLFIPSSASGT